MLVDFADAIGGNVYTLGGTFFKLFAFFFFHSTSDLFHNTYTNTRSS